MLTLFVIVYWLGLTACAAMISAAVAYKCGLNIFKRAVRNGFKGRVGAGLFAGRRVGRTARFNFAGALIASKALRRVF